MARHSKETNTENKVDQKRRDVLERFFELTEKALKHYEWSVGAKKPCIHCNDQGKSKAMVERNGVQVCAMCEGTKMCPDVPQRNWATVEIAERIAPKPKAVEMNIDQTIKAKEFEKEVAGLSNEDLNKQLTALGVTLDVANN